METVIKQAEENRSRSLNIASRIHEEYVPLKGEVDHMRREYLGLNPLPELHEEEGSVITAEYVQCFHIPFSSIVQHVFLFIIQLSVAFSHHSIIRLKEAVEEVSSDRIQFRRTILPGQH